MKIDQASSEKDFQEIDSFFEKMWKEEFNLDASNQIDDYKKCDIYYISKDNEIVSVIIYSKHSNQNCIWRFGTLKSHRGKGYGTVLMKHVLDKYSGNFYLSSDEKQVNYYKKFGFVKNSEKYRYGDTNTIDMVKINTN